MKNMIKLSVIIAAMTLVGCANIPPPVIKIENKVTINKSFDATWEKIIGYFAENNIDIRTIEKSSGILAAERETFSDSYADCGKPSIFLDPNPKLTAKYNVFVTKKGDLADTVKITARFIATYYNTLDKNYVPIECSSRGILEGEILDRVKS